MKKIIKLITKIILIIVLVIVVSVVALFVSFYDNRDVTNYDIVSKQTPAQLVINNSLYDGIYDVKNTKEAEIVFTEEQLEALVYPIVMSLNQEGLIFEIIGCDIDVKNGIYYFEASVSIAEYIKTVLTAKLHIVNENNAFIITLNNLKLGAISVTKIGEYLVKKIDVVQFQNSLKDKNIYATIDLQKFKITCTYDDINKMLELNVPKKQSSLFQLLIDVFLTNKQFMDLSFGNNDLLGIYAHLGTTEFIESIEGELKYSYSFDDVANTVTELLNNNIITYKDVNVVFNYLVRGYSSLEEKEREQIDKLDLSSVSPDKTTYKGIIEKSNITLIDYIDEIFKDKNFTELLTILSDGITLSDGFLTSLLQSFNYMGYSFAFCNEQNKVGYFVLEQLNFVCRDQFIDIHLIMNLNGFKLYLETTFDCLDPKSSGLKINGNIHDLNIGDYKLNDSQKSLLVSYLSELLVDLEWISINESSQEISLDFSKALISIASNNPILNTLFGDSLNSITKTYIEDGYVSIKFFE